MDGLAGCRHGSLHMLWFLAQGFWSVICTTDLWATAKAHYRGLLGLVNTVYMCVCVCVCVLDHLLLCFANPYILFFLICMCNSATLFLQWTRFSTHSNFLSLYIPFFSCILIRSCGFQTPLIFSPMARHNKLLTSCLLIVLLGTYWHLLCR